MLLSAEDIVEILLTVKIVSIFSFEPIESGQLCRYLYYLGRIRTIQLDYTDAKECLLQAARKAPASARGFRIQCTKWAAIVRLLLGEIPERTTFMQPGMRKALRPYFELTNVCSSSPLNSAWVEE